MEKIPVGILGATGAVGQRFVQLLADHPWFKVTAVAASARSAGQRYAEACHWLLPTPMPASIGDLIVQPIEPGLDCRVIFCSLPSDVAAETERRFAQAGYMVCSNASAHRMAPDVPLLIPEVNPGHIDLLQTQRRSRGWSGLIVTSPNCSATPLTLALKPLHDAFGIDRLTVTTLQAISGAGYPGVPALDILGNVVPYIGGEEEKLEHEPQKMMGALVKDQVIPAPFAISAQCNRVAVRDGHTECVSVSMRQKVTLEELTAALVSFRPPREVADLPSTPQQPLVVHPQSDRPQPVLDCDLGAGYAVSVGRIRPCPLFDWKFVVLGHNTMRGAAGGSIHNAELLVHTGWIV